MELFLTQQRKTETEREGVRMKEREREGRWKRERGGGREDEREREGGREDWWNYFWPSLVLVQETSGVSAAKYYLQLILILGTQRKKSIGFGGWGKYCSMSLSPEKPKILHDRLPSGCSFSEGSRSMRVASLPYCTSTWQAFFTDKFVHLCVLRGVHLNVLRTLS